MSYTVIFRNPQGLQTVSVESYSTAVTIACALQAQHNCYGGILTPEGRHEFTWRNLAGSELSPSDWPDFAAPSEPALLPVDRFPRSMHQRCGFPTGDAINIARGTLRPGFEREGAIDRPRYMAAGSHGPRGYTEVYIG